VGIIRGVYERFHVLIQEVAKFGIVGVLAFILTIVGTNALHSGAGLGPLTSVTIATIVATVFSFIGNRNWAFKHRKGKGLGRESVLFFVFNGVGLLIQLAFVAAARYGLGLTDRYSYNVSLIIGVGVATLFRLYAYRQWVFLEVTEPTTAEQLEPEISGRLRALPQQPRTADRPRGARRAAFSWAVVRSPTAAIRPSTCTSLALAWAG
jgi:putative flippase GtrA